MVAEMERNGWVHELLFTILEVWTVRRYWRACFGGRQKLKYIERSGWLETLTSNTYVGPKFTKWRSVRQDREQASYFIRRDSHMAQYEGRSRVAGTRSESVIDQGLRSYMIGVYNYMAGGVALTGIVAFALFSFLTTNDPSLAAAKLRNGVLLTQMGQSVYGSPFWLVVAFAPLAFILFMSFARTSTATAQAMFWAFATVMGLSMSTIFIRYTGESIVQMFFVTSAAFAGLSLYGYTTKKNLTGWGSFLIMGLIGIILASLVNLFLQSGAMAFAISVIGVLIFAGLTAYDTQRIKDEYYVIAGDHDAMARASIFGALSLYLDFVNMFQMLLSLFGSRE